MSLIPAPPTIPPKDTLSLRLDPGVHKRLRAYAAFIHASKDYVIEHMLGLLFRRDKAFGAWLEAQEDATTQRQTMSTEARDSADTEPMAETLPAAIPSPARVRSR
jgi:hypothetical protein